MRTLGLVCIVIFLSVSLFGASKFFFIRTYGTPDGAQYDAKRNLIYVSSHQTSQIFAVATDTGQIKKSVYVPNAAGLDITPDGNQLVVGATAFGGWYGDSFLTFVDLNTFAVAERIPLTNPLHDDSGQQYLDLPIVRKVVALANGNILFTAARAGSTSDWIGRYDRTKHTFSLVAMGDGVLIPSDDRGIL